MQLDEKVVKTKNNVPFSDLFTHCYYFKLIII